MHARVPLFRPRTAAAALAVLTGLSVVQAAAAVDWPRWRGPEDSGSRAAGTYPVKWDATSALWKTPLPGKGCSTPIVWERRLYLTAPIDGRDAVLAYDWGGRELWRTPLGVETAGKHRNGSGSNPSPATDGSAVFVNFKSGTLAAVEFDGSVRWQTNLVEMYGRDTLYWDHGTSPVLTRDAVVMARMHQGESWLAAFDKKTGALRWKVARNYETPTEGDHGYTTPVVIRHGGAEAILVWGGQHLTAHRATDGGVIWTCGDFNPEARAYWPAVASPVVSGDVAVVPFGRADRGLPRLHGVKLGGDGDVTATHRVWKRDDVGTFVPTPAVVGDRVYVVRDRGEVDCLDASSGKTVWSAAFPRASANFYASPTVAGGKLYAAREDGVVFVASIENGFQLLSENAMGERVIASPVPLGDRLILRGEEHLYCFGAP